MFRARIIVINQHENKWCCEEETLPELYTCKLHSALYNISPYFAPYGKNPSIHELITFGCDIYPITSSPEHIYDITQELSFMGYTNIRDTI